MKTFSMSQYPNKETLYQAKAEYYKSLVYSLAEEFNTFGLLYLDEDNKYRWASTGELLG